MTSAVTRMVPTHPGTRLCAAALVLALFAFAPIGDASFDGYNLPKELLLAALCAALATRLPRPADRLSWLAWSIAGLSVLSALFATHGWLAARAAMLTLSGVTLFEAARGLDEEGREQLLRVAAASAVALALIAFLESQGLLAGLSRTGRAPGATVGQRNAVAHVLVLSLPLVAHLAARDRRWLGGALLLACVIVLTRCRSAWLALPVALLAARQWRALAASAAGVVLAVVLPTRLVWTSSAPLADTLGRLTDSTHGSGLGRLTQWRASLDLVFAHPLLGTGPANWMVEYPTVTPPADPSFQSGAQLPTGRLLTSDWVSVPVERGVPCAIAVLLLGVLAARHLRSTPHALGTFAALVVVGTFDSVLQLPATLALAAVLLGCSLPATAPAVGRGPAWALRGVLVAGALYAATLLAGFFLRLGAGFERLELAARVAPGDPVVRLTLSEAYVLEGRCAEARPHLEALTRQLPHHPSVKSLAAACP